MKTFVIKIVSLLLLIFFGQTAWSQQQDVIRGRVFDQESRSPLPVTSISIPSLKLQTTSDGEGLFAISIDPGTYTVIFSFIGYVPDSVVIDSHHAVPLNIYLRPVPTQLDSITVSTDAAREKVLETETGHILLQKKELENLPYLMGEQDPIRILQLMPGVQTAGEGSTGYYVRGGAIDQNLMLLDNATVYNPSHLFGFFSIFNGSVVNSLEMYKSGIPSYFGGRLSSVTQVKTRKGDTKRMRAEGGIGIIATNFLVEGPIRKGKGSFLIAARRTYVDFLIQGLHKASIYTRDINYYFFDLNVNLDYNLTSRDQITLRSYEGKDKFNYATSDEFKNNITWKNKTLAMHWLHNYSESTYSDLSLQGSIYAMNFGASINDYSFYVDSNIKDMGFTYQLNHTIKKHALAAGLSYTHHSVSPNNINAYSSDVELTVSPHLKLQGGEAAVFVNDKITLSSRSELSVGVRLSGYTQVGPFTRYTEDENFQILDTIRYRRNSWISTYVVPEPRVAFRYKLNDESSLKFSFDRTAQYMHMAPLSSVSLPLDIWVPSSAVIKPQLANQFAGGYFRNFKPGIETYATLYYKDMFNQIEYRQGVIIGYSKGVNYDDNFVFGRGKSYGAEFSFKKSTGKLTGQLAYTLSRTIRKFPDLNAGKVFPAKYDRLHDLALMLNYNHSTRWIFSMVFVYATGNALNLPIARYVIQGNVVNEYGPRNSFRMPAYHRMDLGITYAIKKSKSFESYIILSVYNLYNRRNPYYIYFESKGNLQNYELSTNIKQVSLFPIIPAITYRFKF